MISIIFFVIFLFFGFNKIFKIFGKWIKIFFTKKVQKPLAIGRFLLYNLKACAVKM